MAAPTTLEKLRDCGHLEKLSTARHHLGFYNSVGSTATYSRQRATGSLPDLIFSALRIVIHQHPALSATPVEEDGNSPYFVRLPTIDLRTCVQFQERRSAVSGPGSRDEELDAILEEQHNTSFHGKTGSRPFWSLIVLHAPGSSTHFTASWIYHHALADGASGLVFHRSLLSALQTASMTLDSAFNNGEIVDVDPIVPSPTGALLPSLEQIHPLPLSLSYLAKQQWYDWFPKSTDGLWLGNEIPTLDSDRNRPPSASSVPRMRFRSLVLPQQMTTKLITLSRKNNVTMHATLQCLIAAAVFANLPEDKWTKLRGCAPISLRRFLKLDSKYGSIDDCLGTWVSNYTFEHTRRRPLEVSTPSETENQGKARAVVDLFSWTEAQSLKQSIAIELDKNLKDSVVNLLRWVPDTHGWFLNKLGKPRTESFELSNVGAVKTSMPAKAINVDGSVVKSGAEDEIDGQWRMGKCIFSQSAPVTGAAFLVGAVTGGDGCAVLGFSWLDGSVENEWMINVIKGLEKGAEALISQ